MLPYKGAAVDSDHFMAGKGDLYGVACELVILRLPVGRHENHFRGDKIIGISGRQTFAVFINNGIRQRQLHKIIWLALAVAEHRELCPHRKQRLKLRVIHIPATGEKDNIVGSHTAKGVDMRIRVVSFKGTMLKPEDMVESKTPSEYLVQTLPRQSAIAVGALQAAGRGQQSAVAVGLYRASFEYEIPLIPICVGRNNIFLGKVHVYQVIAVGGKFEPPGIESEIEQAIPFTTRHGNRTVISCPGIVIFHFHQGHEISADSGEGREAILHCRRQHDAMDAFRREGFDYPAILGACLVENIVPVGMGRRECQKNGSARFPFRHHSYIIVCHRANLRKNHYFCKVKAHIMSTATHNNKHNTAEEFAAAIKICRDVFVKKLKDYGTSWRVMRPSSLTDQIYIKAKRIRNLEELGTAAAEVDEGIEPEFIGIVNYCAIALIQLRLGYGEPIPADEALKLYDGEIEAATALMNNKNHDYDEAWREMRVSSFTDIILQKLMRTKEIESHNGKTLVSEGIDANYMDMINYALFALIKLNY